MLEIAAVRLVAAEDQTHYHVELIGYVSPHLPDEPIMIDVSRLLQRMALGEKFFVAANGEQAEVSESKCARCGFAPYLKTAADTAEDEKLQALAPR